MIGGAVLTSVGLFYAWMSGFAIPQHREMIIAAGVAGAAIGTLCFISGGVLIWRALRKSKNRL